MMVDDKQNTLELIKSVFSKDMSRVDEPGFNGEQDNLILDECMERMKTAKNFYLDVEKSSGIYAEIMSKKQIHDTQEGHFVLPFDNCLIAFDKPITIRWRKSNTHPPEYEGTGLYGFLIYRINEDIGNNFKNSLYRTLLFLKENDSSIEGLPKEEAFILGAQFINYWVCEVTNNGKDEMLLGHVGHNPCGDKLLCSIGYNGMEKYPNAKRAWACEEIVVRDGFVEFIQKLAEKIYEVQVDYVHKKSSNWWQDKKGDFYPSLPIGWPFTKGNLPKDNYVQYLDGRRKVYDKDKIDIGSGTHHRYRYDVRRHPRIVGDKIVWISPHQRGSGRYIPKVYSNRRTWFINYFWYQAEKLTKYRIIEILLIRIISLFKKHIAKYPRK